MTPQEFIHKWRTVQLKERSLYQKRFLDLYKYNQRLTWLHLAHEKLDRAVFAAYGWEWGLGEDEVLGKLLEENLRRGG